LLGDQLTFDLSEFESQCLDFQSVKLNSGTHPLRVCLERTKLGDEPFPQRGIEVRCGEFVRKGQG